MLERQPIERARRDHQARDDVVGRQRQRVARLRRPLKRERARRWRAKPSTRPVVERGARLFERQRHEVEPERRRAARVLMGSMSSDHSLTARSSSKVRTGCAARGSLPPTCASPRCTKPDLRNSSSKSGRSRVATYLASSRSWNRPGQPRHRRPTAPSARIATSRRPCRRADRARCACRLRRRRRRCRRGTTSGDADRWW